MYVADSKRLTHEGAKMMVDAAVTKARSAGIAISVAVVDAGGHLLAALFDPMAAHVRGPRRDAAVGDRAGRQTVVGRRIRGR